MSQDNLGRLFFNFLTGKANFDCSYPFAKDLAPNGVPFDAKSIVKV